MFSSNQDPDLILVKTACPPHSDGVSSPLALCQWASENQTVNSHQLLISGMDAPEYFNPFLDISAVSGCLVFVHHKWCYNSFVLMNYSRK